jgi:drug/metabolite transporter (DMT)-like permease
MRKWISPALDDKEIAVLHTFFVFMFAFMFSQILGEGVSEFAAVPLSLVLVVFLAGTTFISLAFFSSYAFKRVEAIIANNILILESVFALLIGLAVYQEVPTFKEILGGILIVLSAVLMNKVQFGNKA